MGQQRLHAFSVRVIAPRRCPRGPLRPQARFPSWRFVVRGCFITLRRRAQCATSHRCAGAPRRWGGAPHSRQPGGTPSIILPARQVKSYRRLVGHQWHGHGGGLGGALFLLPIDLQTVLRYTPLAAGLSLLPVTLLMLALSARSGAVAARIGPRLQMSAGPILVGAGLVLLARISPGGNYLRSVLPAALVLGFGLVVTVAPLTSTVLAAVPSEHAGVASAVNNDVARAASALPPPREWQCGLDAPAPSPSNARQRTKAQRGSV